MNWKKAIGFGALVWVLMFVIVSAFIGFGIYDSVWMEVVAAIIGGVISFILAGYLKLKKYSEAFGYAVVWVVIWLILDAAITTRFNVAIFSAWSLWLGYGLGFLAVFLRVKK